MTKRPTLAESATLKPAQEATRREEGVDPYAKPKRSGNRRADTHERFTVYLPITLAERLRDVAWATAGTTISALVEEAILREIQRREAERGKPFKRRSGEVRKGRPKEAK